MIVDFDDTLASDDKTVSKNNLDSINAFISRGGKFVVSTGRMSTGISPHLESIGYKGLVSMYNGGEIKDYNTGEVIFQKQIPYNLVIKFADYCREKGIYFQTYPNNSVVVERVTDNTIYYRILSHIKETVVPSVSEYFRENKFSSSKLIIFDKVERFTPCVEELRILIPECDFIISNDKLVEITLKGISKGSALTYLSNLYNIDREETIAVGDGGNDLPMLKAAGIPIAVENAVEELKKAAKVIAPNNNKDAIKWVIENYCI